MSYVADDNMRSLSLRAPSELVEKIVEVRVKVGKDFTSSQVARRAMTIGLKILENNPSLMVRDP